METITGKEVYHSMNRLFGVGLFVIDSILDMFWALCRVLYLCSVYINKNL